MMTSKHAQRVNMHVFTPVILSITGSAQLKHCINNYYINDFDTFDVTHNFLLIIIHLLSSGIKITAPGLTVI